MTTQPNWAAAPAAMLRHTRPTMYAACEPPPPGPRHETDEEFQRRVDELLSYKTPFWRDAAFYCLITGVFCLALSGTLWWFGH